MTLLLLISLAAAGDYDGKIYTYRIDEELVEGLEYWVEASNGVFYCKATLPCPGLDKGTEIETYRPTWHAPLRIYYFDAEVLRYCELKSCEKTKLITYQDL
tara:strand:- start:7214 stop:7516 length:303 start_codon:yes stop_codon:yes gene_type:complete